MAPILLSAYDAKRCARRVHNEWDPSIERTEEWVPSSGLQVRLDAGLAHQERIVAQLKADLPAGTWVDLSGSFNPRDTVAAMDAGIPVILGGRLPNDPVGGRKGAPDLLLRIEGGYVAGEIKGHKITQRSTAGTLLRSSFSAPTEIESLEGATAKTSYRIDDYLQVAHYQRMLEAAGHASPGPIRAFVIGTDLHDDQPFLTWLRLDEPFFETYSRSAGRKKRTAMERYDHEQSFRLKVATASAAGEPALVQPIFTEECDGCPWYDYCLALTGPDVASANITSGRLSRREYSALTALGVQTLDDLVALDVESPGFQERYLPEVTHVTDPLGRLASARRRARMSRDGRDIERSTEGAIEVPRADVEIDFDIEWDPQNQVYLWGALIDGDYVSFVSWREDPDDFRLATEFADWLRGIIADAESAGRTVAVYHYTGAEPDQLKRVLGADEVADLLPHFVDLYPLVKENYFGLSGLGIKHIAPYFGFAWRDDEPGGLQSQVWLIEARDNSEDARQRILDYNEDDVRATAALRAGLAGEV